MLSALVAVSLLAQGGADNQQVNPSVLVSKMLAYYNDAETMTGTILMTAKAGSDATSVLTTVQFEKPGKIYIRQQKSSGDRRVWLTVSDGKEFAYNVPITSEIDNPDTRLREPMKVKNYQMTIKEVYAASSAGLGDRSTPLDIAIGRLEDLKFIRDQWATVEYKGTTDYEGAQVHIIMGKWRPYGNSLASGDYRMYITDSGELKQFARSEKFGNDLGQTVDLLTTWDVKLVKNGKPDGKLFRIQ